MSNPYRCDIVTTLSLPYGFDIESISLRCRIHIVAMSNLYRNDNAIAISLPYGFDIKMITILTSYTYRNDIESISLRHRNDVIVSICIRHRNDNDFDIESISLRCQIHIDNITIRIQCRYDMDSMSNPY